MILNCPTTNNPTGSNTQGEPINTAITDKGNNDGTTVTTYPDGTVTTKLPDGTTTTQNPSGATITTETTTTTVPPPTMSTTDPILTVGLDAETFNFGEFPEGVLVPNKETRAQAAFLRVRTKMIAQANALLNEGFPLDIEAPPEIRNVHVGLVGLNVGLDNPGSFAPREGLYYLHKALNNIGVSCGAGSTAEKLEKAAYYNASQYGQFPATPYIAEISSFLSSLSGTKYASYANDVEFSQYGVCDLKGLVNAIKPDLISEIEAKLPDGTDPDGTPWKDRAVYLVTAIEDNREFAAFVADLNTYGYGNNTLSRATELSQTLNAVCKINSKSNERVL